MDKIFNFFSSLSEFYIGICITFAIWLSTKIINASALLHKIPEIEDRLSIHEDNFKELNRIIIKNIEEERNLRREENHRYYLAIKDLINASLSTK